MPLNAATLAGTLAHEVMHPALRHHTRRAGRDPRRWNEACDYAINPLLLDAGLRLPEGVLMDDRFRGMSAEEIYNRLETGSPKSDYRRNEPASDAETQSEATSDALTPAAPTSKGGIGQVIDAPVEVEAEEQERD